MTTTQSRLAFFLVASISAGGCVASGPATEDDPTAEAEGELRSLGPACSETLTERGLAKIAVSHEVGPVTDPIPTSFGNVLGRYETIVHRRRCSANGDVCTRWEKIDPKTAASGIPTFVVSRFEEVRTGRFVLVQNEDHTLTLAIVSNRYVAGGCSGYATSWERLDVDHSRARVTDLTLETADDCGGGVPSFMWENITYRGFSGRVGDHCAKLEARPKVDAGIGYDEYSVVLSSTW